MNFRKSLVMQFEFCVTYFDCKVICAEFLHSKIHFNNVILPHVFLFHLEDHVHIFMNTFNSCLRQPVVIVFLFAMISIR